MLENWYEVIRASVTRVDGVVPEPAFQYSEYDVIGDYPVLSPVRAVHVTLMKVSLYA